MEDILDPYEEKLGRDCKGCWTVTTSLMTSHFFTKNGTTGPETQGKLCGN